jgi:hypothetical protein
LAATVAQPVDPKRDAILSLLDSTLPRPAVDAGFFCCGGTRLDTLIIPVSFYLASLQFSMIVEISG